MTKPHTPTPWETEPYAVRGAWIRGADKQWAALSCGVNDDTAGANAAFIVRAVNNHDDLVGCVRAALNMIDGDGIPPNWDLLREVLKAAA